MISLKQENVDITVTNHSDFSIEHILNHAGNRTADKQREDVQPNENQSTPTFSWLQCTRFCPPKIASKLKNYIDFFYINKTSYFRQYCNTIY